MSQRAQTRERTSSRVGLGERTGHHPGQLSGGQQQRVAIDARALVNQPAILMADEPTGNLDSKTSRDIMHLFQELNQSDGITIILVTHDQEVARNARRAVVCARWPNRGGYDRFFSGSQPFIHARRTVGLAQQLQP